MKRLLLISFLSSSISLFGAAGDPVIQLEPELVQIYSGLMKKGYDAAEAEVVASGGQLYGTVPEIYSTIIAQGCQKFLDENRDIAHRTLEILDLFSNSFIYPIATEIPKIKEAENAFNAAQKDPQNTDLWIIEARFFSEALMEIAEKKMKMTGLMRFDAHPKTTERIVHNNGLKATPEQRVEIAAHMMAVLVRLNQRYSIMGHEAFMIFVPKMIVLIEQLAQEAAAKQS